MGKKMMRLFMLLAAAVAVATVTGRAQSAEEDRVIGVWLTAEGKGKVEVYHCGEEFCGRIVWTRDSLKNGKPLVDDKNPNEALRNRPVRGLEIMRAFRYDGDDEWTGGKIYDPESGDEYSAKMMLQEDGTLVLRGYILIPLLGRSETWTRVMSGADK
jgi:uncharacterized protein (DUF2147 family)